MFVSVGITVQNPPVVFMRADHELRAKLHFVAKKASLMGNCNYLVFKSFKDAACVSRENHQGQHW